MKKLLLSFFLIYSCSSFAEQKIDCNPIKIINTTKNTTELGLATNNINQAAFLASPVNSSNLSPAVGAFLGVVINAFNSSNYPTGSSMIGTTQAHP